MKIICLFVIILLGQCLASKEKTVSRKKRQVPFGGGTMFPGRVFGGGPVMAPGIGPMGFQQQPGRACPQTTRDSLGPFYLPGYPLKQFFCSPNDRAQQGLTVSGQVLTQCGTTPLAGARIEIWQADLTGQYTDACRGYVVTDQLGNYQINTAMPGLYPGRPRHIHYLVTGQAFSFVGQLYFAQDPERLRYGGTAMDPTLTTNAIQVAPNLRSARYNIYVNGF